LRCCLLRCCCHLLQLCRLLLCLLLLLAALPALLPAERTFDLGLSKLVIIVII
jgi:hypothetical protein